MPESKNKFLSLGDSILMDATALDSITTGYFEGEPMHHESIFQLCESLQRDIKAIKGLTARNKGKI